MDTLEQVRCMEVAGNDLLDRHGTRRRGRQRPREQPPEDLHNE
jgi:hypothetical protein